jgi:hypothetical protein
MGRAHLASVSVIIVAYFWNLGNEELNVGVLSAGIGKNFLGCREML